MKMYKGSKCFIFRFADVEVREREFREAFRVLLTLSRNSQKPITKEELLNAVWGEPLGSGIWQNAGLEAVSPRPKNPEWGTALLSWSS